jgi:hypothetical protein
VTETPTADGSPDDPLPDDAVNGSSAGPDPVVDPMGDDRAAVIRRARKIGGLPGAVLAGALMGLKDVLDPPKDKQAVVVEASSEPHDIDKDGIDMELDGTRRAVAPPLPPMLPHPVRRRRRRHHER